MNLFVDDIREPWEGWHLVRTVTDAIRVLSTGHVDIVSLDHDIRQCAGKRCANRNEVFEPVARYIALMNPRPMVLFHTGNRAGGQRMANILGLDYMAQRIDYDNFLKRGDF